MSSIRTFEKLVNRKNNFVLKFERVRGVAPRQFTEKGKYHFYVRIYLDQQGKNEPGFNSFSDIELVKYELDPTFKDRIRVATESSRNFEIRIWTYGFFRIKATVFLKGGGIENISDNLSFEVEDEYRKLNPEEFTW